MRQFWSFEATVAKIYASLGKPKSDYNKLEQLGVSFVGGYIAGVFCAVVSHPADTMVSKVGRPPMPRTMTSADFAPYFDSSTLRARVRLPCLTVANTCGDCADACPIVSIAGVAKPTVGSIYKEIGFGGLWAGLGTRQVREPSYTRYRDTF